MLERAPKNENDTSDNETPPRRRRISRSISPTWRPPASWCASTARSTRTPSCIRWCAGSSRAASTRDERRAFLFTNVVGADGRRFDMPVAAGALSASAQIYALGMGRAVDDIGRAWTDAIAHPVPPVTVTAPPCQEVVITGDDLRGPGNGLAAPAGAGVDAGLRCRALSHRDLVHHQGSGHRRAQHGHLPGPAQGRPTGSACAWPRASAAPAAICTGRNTVPARSRCRSPSWSAAPRWWRSRARRSSPSIRTRWRSPARSPAIRSAPRAPSRSTSTCRPTPRS